MRDFVLVGAAGVLILIVVLWMYRDGGPGSARTLPVPPEFPPAGYGVFAAS
jgi:hypothetical protein